VPAIEAEGVGFSFGALRVLRGVSLWVEEGAVLSVFGPNGAGKTTLLKILAGLLKPETGKVRIEGIELGQDPARFRKSIGVISHHPYVYPRLSGRENLEFYGRLYGLKDPRTEARRILEDMGLTPVMDREVSTYSRGMLQRLAVGRALLHRPRVLLLDEPFTGLDQQARERLETLLSTLRDGERTVLLTTHDVGGGLGLADRVAVLANGSIAIEMPTTGLDDGAFLDRYREVTAAGRAPGAERPAP
jgi:heme exporter protein A